MTNSKAKVTTEQVELIEPNEQDVLHFLNQHPDFLMKHQELVAKLRLPHGEEGTVSLVEKQQGILREKVNKLESEINRLITIAKQNESIYNTFMNLYLALLDCPDSKQLMYLLRAVLVDKLGLEAMRLVLFVATNDETAIDLVEPRNQYQEVLTDRLVRDDYYFGRLKKQESALFFPPEKDIGSVALVRLGGQKDLGILAFGSHDQNHFRPDMDTVFLAPMVKLINRLLLDFSNNG